MKVNINVLKSSLEDVLNFLSPCNSVDTKRWIFDTIVLLSITMSSK